MAGRAAAGRLQRQCVSNLVYENAWVCITAPLAEGAVLQTAAGSGTLPALLSPQQRQHHRHLAALSAGAARETVIDAMRRPHAPKGRATRFSAYRSRLPRVRKCATEQQPVLLVLLLLLLLLLLLPLLPLL